MNILVLLLTLLVLPVRGEDSPFPTIEMFSDDGYFWYVLVDVGDQPSRLLVDITEPNFWVLNSTAFPSCSGTTVEYTQTLTLGSDTLTSTETAVYVTATGSQLSTAQDCQYMGAYSPAASNSSIQSYESYNGTNIDNEERAGSLVQDNVTIHNFMSNSTVPLGVVEFIDVNETSADLGSLGLAGVDTTVPNANLLQQLTQNGLLNSSAYSFAPASNATGRIILGGVDTALFDGPLVAYDTIPFAYSETDIRHLYPIVPFTGMAVRNARGNTVWVSEAGTVPVLLDSGTPFLYLPYSTVVSLAVQLNAFYWEPQGQWFLKCSTADVGASVKFQFGNLTVDVPLDQLVQPIYDVNNTQVTFEDGSASCILLVLPDNYLGYSVLGSPFLNSLYLAVDNEGQRIAMAQANKATGQSVNTTTTSLKTSNGTSSTSLPYASSEISSGYIPFAVSNNITDLLTMSVNVQSLSPSVAVTAVYTSGQIYTGRVENSTTTLDEGYTTQSTATPSAMAVRLQCGFVTGMVASFFALVIGILV